jgi:hypothetical protein
VGAFIQFAGLSDALREVNTRMPTTTAGFIDYATTLSEACAASLEELHRLAPPANAAAYHGRMEDFLVSLKRESDALLSALRRGSSSSSVAAANAVDELLRTRYAVLGQEFSALWSAAVQ